jgi:xylulokinase
MDRYLLGIDIGTSACKVIAVDSLGQVVAKALASYPILSLQPGWAEQDPEDWWNATVNALRDVLAALPERRAVCGIGLSGQMHGLTALDDAERVIRRAPLR